MKGGKTMFRFYKDNKVFADNVALPYTITGLTSDTQYPAGYFTYTVVDAKGNESPLKPLQAFKTLKDEEQDNQDKQPDKPAENQDKDSTTDTATTDKSKVQ